jgi:hypothetical protein
METKNKYRGLKNTLKDYYKQEKNKARKKLLHTLDSLNKDQKKSLKKSELEILADTLKKWVENENAQLKANYQIKGSLNDKLYGYDQWLQKLKLIEHKTREEYSPLDPEEWKEVYDTYTMHYYEITQKGKALYQQIFGGEQDGKQ